MHRHNSTPRRCDSTIFCYDSERRRCDSYAPRCDSALKRRDSAASSGRRALGG